MNVINKFEKKVKDYIYSNEMINSNDKIVVGVSGGADSICLLHLLNKLKIPLIAVHINHCIRGKEADEDERYVVDTCGSLGIVCKVFREKIEDIAKEKKLTEEEAGRIVRYNSFRKVMKEYSANKIAVAHNMNDNAETVLFNIFRGSGMVGIGGIKPQNDDIIRPLMCVTRNEIEEYLNKQEIVFKNDRTNFEEEYTRNKIRLNILPYVEENINKKAVKHMSDMASMARDTEDFINDYVKNLFDKVVVIDENNVYHLDVKALSNEKKIIQKKLVRYVINCIISRLKDIEAVHIDDIVGLINKQVGKKIMLPYGLVAIKEYTAIKIIIDKDNKSNENKEKKAEAAFEILDFNDKKSYYIDYYDAYLRFRIIKNKKGLIIPKNNYTKWFDYGKINNIVKIRNRCQGDFIQLNRQGGKKKLKDFFIDSKVDKNIRDRIPLLADGSHVMWVIGMRSSEGYLVDENTENILEVCLD